MPRPTGTYFAPALALGFAALTSLSGCGKTEGPAPTQLKTVALPAVDAQPALPEFPPGPPVMELSDPKVTLRDPHLVHCEVQYRFTQGGPQRNDTYDFEITFPGTPNVGIKLMHTWELKMDGTIKDGFPLPQSGVRTFEIKVLETAKLDRPGRKRISNVVTGTIDR